VYINHYSDWVLLVKKIFLNKSDLIKRPLWDPRTGRMEETNNRALQVLDRLMDRPGVNIEAFKRVADCCDEEEGFHGGRTWR